MDKLTAWWRARSKQERLMIGVGVPLVALAAIVTGRRKKAATAPADTTPAGNPLLGPQVFNPFNVDTTPVTTIIDQGTTSISQATSMLVDTVNPRNARFVEPTPTVVVTVPETTVTPTPPTTAPSLNYPSDHFPWADNDTVIQTGNDLIGKGADASAYVDTLAFRIHAGVLSIGDSHFAYSFDPAQGWMAIREPVRVRLAQVGW